MAAKQCVVKMVTACRIFELNDSRVAETLKQLQLVNKDDNSDCGDHDEGLHHSSWCYLLQGALMSC